MSDARFDRIQRLFQEALDLPEDERVSWLRSQCGADGKLFQEVRSLLEHDSPQDDPLEVPLDQAITGLERTVLGSDSILNTDTGDYRDTIVDGDVFLSHLARIGILSDGEISALNDRQSGEGESSDPSLLASQLVTEGKLSDFQAQALLRGQPELLLDKYLIIDLIGSGGMGTVFKAIHRPMNRIVAIKMISKHLLDSSSQLQRFKREVRVAATLENVNIVRAYDADQFEGAHFFVMEFVRGENLAKIVQRDGPLTVQKAVNCIRQAARGLRYAHGHGVVHRDIKPGNLMMTDAGLVKVVDLGLANVDDSFRWIQRSKETGDETHVGNHLTQVGAVLGTASFMAPEQSLDAGSANPRSDIYSLGCTLYFLLTGEPPFKGRTTIEVLVQHRDTKIPSLQVSRPDVPHSIDAIFRRMVAKDPHERFSSMGELIAAIDDSGVGADLGRERTSRNPEVASTGTLDRKRDDVSRASSTSRAIWLFAAFAGLIGLCVIGYAIGEFSARPNDAHIGIVDRGHTDFSTGVGILQFNGTSITDAVLANSLKGQTELTELHLASTSIGDEGMASIGQCQKLEVLELDGTEITSQGLRHLSGLRNLRELSLDLTTLDDEGLKHLRKVTSLEYLSLAFTQITDDGLGWLRELKNLRYLHLGRTSISDRGVENLIGLDLRNLGLYATRVSDSGLERLSEFGNLAWLHLGATQITDKGIGHLREIKNLRDLRLNGAAKIDDGALEELKGFTLLERLDIQGTGLTNAGYKELQRALPDCEIAMGGLDGSQGMAILQKQADLYTSRQDWGEAHHAYRRLVELNPKSGRLWTELMDVAQWDDSAKGNSFDSSVAIFNEAGEALGEDRLDLGIEMVHCLSCLLADRPEEYERVCRIIASKYLNSDVPRTQFQVAKILALGEEPVVYPDELVSIARKAIEAEPATQYFRLALALCLIRAGKYDEAIASIEGNAALIALAHAKSGDDDEARRWLKLAREEIQDNPLDPRSTWIPVHRISWRLYLRETEKLLEER